MSETPKLIRPSVGMWSHGESRWYVQNMHGEIEWHDSAQQADSKALTNIQDYAEQLERELNEAKRIQKSTEEVWHGAEAELTKTRSERDEWKACAEGQMQSLTWPHVLAFAKRMEAKLEKNRHKGNREGWLKDHPWNLVERILDETVELQQCFTAFGSNTVNLTRTPEETADECADVANFCMMVSDNITTFNQLKEKSK